MLWSSVTKISPLRSPSRRIGTHRMTMALLALTASASAYQLRPSPHSVHCQPRRVAVPLLSANDQMETALLRLCALTDRGQKTDARQRQQLEFYIQALESDAPSADATDLNGEWRLLAAIGETAYRSSPFFWAFRQATAACVHPPRRKHDRRAPVCARTHSHVCARAPVPRPG